MIVAHAIAFKSQLIAQKNKFSKLKIAFVFVRIWIKLIVVSKRTEFGILKIANASARSTNSAQLDSSSINPVASKYLNCDYIIGILTDFFF